MRLVSAGFFGRPPCKAVAQGPGDKVARVEGGGFLPGQPFDGATGQIQAKDMGVFVRLFDVVHALPERIQPLQNLGLDCKARIKIRQHTVTHPVQNLPETPGKRGYLAFSSRAISDEVSQRLPPIFCISA